VDQLEDTASGVVDNVSNTVDHAAGNAGDTVDDLANDVSSAIDDAAGNVEDTVGDVVDDVGGTVDDATDGLSGVVQGITSDLPINSLLDQLDDVANVGDTIHDLGLDHLSDNALVSDLGHSVNGLVNSAGNNLNGFLHSLPAHLNHTVDQVASTATSAVSNAHAVDHVFGLLGRARGLI
jgi:uncharacterized protein YjbJ (UPF0337 family)